MTNIQYLIGDATRPEGPGPKIIAHVCNDRGGWGRGFVLALSRRWPEPEQQYRDARPVLGRVQLVQVEFDLWVANMVAQDGFPCSTNRGVALDYEALAECLDKVEHEAMLLRATVHMPRIGCGLAGGSWPEVEKIIIEKLSVRDVPVFVYDLK